MRIISRFIQSIPILQNSMLPTIRHGDRVLSISSSLVTLRRGDVVVFNDNYGQRSIKRIAGLPGESVSIKEGKVFINGCALKEANLLNDESDFGPLLLQKAAYFVLGDNRQVSEDSRVFGPVDIRDITYKALAIYRPVKRIRLL